MTVAEKIYQTKSIATRFDLLYKNKIKITSIGYWYRKYTFIDGSQIEARFYHTDLLLKTVK